MTSRVFWASIVLDSVLEQGTPWVLYVNARTATGTGIHAVDGPRRLVGALADPDALAAAEAQLRRTAWQRASPWEDRDRGWVCWVEPSDLDRLRDLDRADGSDGSDGLRDQLVEARECAVVVGR